MEKQIKLSLNLIAVFHAERENECSIVWSSNTFGNGYVYSLALKQAYLLAKTKKL